MAEQEVRQAKLLAEVQWGVIPGTVEGQKQWGFTVEQIEAAESWEQLLAEAYEQFKKCMNPRLYNWTTMTWLWL